MMLSMTKRSIRGSLLLMLVISVLCVGLAGCGDNNQANSVKDDFTAQNAELKQLLPAQAGYHWVYSGFVEYGHMLNLKTVTAGDSETVYHLSGAVGDPSGGEARGDFSLSVNYIITKGNLIQEVTGEKMMDTFTHMELLRTPLQPGTKWEQKVKDRENKEYELACAITAVDEESGGKVYTVEYKDKNSDFYEQRVFKEKTGVIQFEKIWQSKEGPVVMGYALYDDASGYPQKSELKAFLPPLDRELRYFGLAEYAHVGTMTKVSENDRQGVYRFNGSFQDGSGIPGEFKINYTFDYVAGSVREEVLENTRSGQKEINSKIHDPILLKYPLTVGNIWEQEVLFEGQKKMMIAQIVSIAYQGHTFYTQQKQRYPVMTVRYTVENVPGYFQDTYIEERSFQKGWGMIGYSHLMKGGLDITDQTNAYEVENVIINNMFGYSVAKE